MVPPLSCPVSSPQSLFSMQCYRKALLMPLIVFPWTFPLLNFSVLSLVMGSELTSLTGALNEKEEARKGEKRMINYRSQKQNSSKSKPM